MLYKTYDYNLNVYSLFCKINSSWKKDLRNNRRISGISSNKKIIQSKELSIVSFISLFIAFGSIPKAINLKKPTSFFRGRYIQLWGYKSHVTGKRFYDVMLNVKANIFKKNIDYGFLKKGSFFFGRRRFIGLPNISIFDELSETNFYLYRAKFGLSLQICNRLKNYVNIYPYL